MDTEDRLWEQLDSDPDVQAIKRRLSALEAKIKSIVADDAWDLVLEWEELWAHYVTVCLHKLRGGNAPEKPSS